MAQTATIDRISKDSLRQIIQQGDARELVAQAEIIGTAYGTKDSRTRESAVTTNQIRAIFSTVRQIEMTWTGKDEGQAARAERELVLLKPKVIFRVAREKNPTPEFQHFADMMVKAIDVIVTNDNKDDKDNSSYKRFKNFVDFFEAILAYHKVVSSS